MNQNIMRNNKNHGNRPKRVRLMLMREAFAQRPFYRTVSALSASAAPATVSASSVSSASSTPLPAPSRFYRTQSLPTMPRRQQKPLNARITRADVVRRCEDIVRCVKQKTAVDMRTVRELLSWLECFNSALKVDKTNHRRQTERLPAR